MQLVSIRRDQNIHGLSQTAEARKARARAAIAMAVEALEDRRLLSAMLVTNQPDYAPGSTAVFTAANDGAPGRNFRTGETIQFHLVRTDGVPIKSPPAVQTFDVTDGVGGFAPYQDASGVWRFPDTDGKANGAVQANWHVDSQFAGASLALTATGLSSGAVAKTSFTDSIGAPTNIGQNSSTSSNTSISVTVPAAGVAVGNTVIVTFAMANTSGAVSVTDTKGNVYHSDADVMNTSGVRTLVFSAPVTTALVSGNTITVSYPSNSRKAVSAFSVSGLVSASPADQSITASGSSTAPNSGTSGTTAQANELLIGAIGMQSRSSGMTFTPGTGFTKLTDATADLILTNYSTWIVPEYRVVSAAGTYSANATLSSSRVWAAALVTYKAAILAASTTTISLAAGNSTSTYGDSLTFHADVSGEGGTPTGTVQFKLGSANLGSPVALTGGGADLTLSTVAAGTAQQITAVYSGDGTFESSTSDAIGQTVNQKSLTASLTGTVSKVYDGNTAATLAAGNYALLGVLTGDTVTVSGSGTFDTKDAGTGKTINVTGLALAGASAGNYVLASNSISGAIGTITPKALTTTGLAADNKIYDATTAATLTGAAALQAAEAAGAGTTSDGKPYTGDTVSVEGTPGGTFASANVANNISVSISGLSLTGADAGNYTLTTTLTANITKKALTISGLSALASKVYDGSTSATVSGSPGSLQPTEAAGTGTTTDGAPYSADSVSLSGTATGTYNSKDVATATTVTFAGLSLTGTGSGNYSITYPTQAATITAKALTVSGVTANSKIYDGTMAATINTTGAALVGVIAGDTVAINSSGASGVFTDASVGGSKTVDVSGLALSGAAAGNYILIQPTATTGAAAVGTPTSIGQNNSISTDSSISVTVPAAGVAVGNTVVVTFAMANTAGTVTVTDAKGNVYHADADVTNTSGVRTLVFSSPVTTALVSGNTITVSYPSNNRKAVSAFSVSGLVSASPADQSKTATGSSTTPNSGTSATTVQAGELLIGAIGVQAYTSTSITVGSGYTALTGATANGGSSSSSAWIYPEYRVVSATGTYSAGATLSTGRQWAAALVTYKAFVPGLAITARPITVTAIANSKTYDGTTAAAATPSVTGGLLAGDTASFIETYDNANAGTGKTLVPSGTINDGNGGNNYAITFVPLSTGVISAAPLSITANGDSKTYGQTRNYGSGSTAFSSSGLVNGETIGSVTLAASGGTAANEPVGSYDLTPSAASGGTFSASNYNITYNPGTLTVNPLAVVLSGNRTYDGTAAAGTLSVANRVGSDDVLVDSGDAALSSGNVGIRMITSFGGMVLGGVSAGNYTLVGASGMVTISAAPLTIAANNDSKTYGQGKSYGPGSKAFTSTGLQNGETIGSVTLTASGGTASAAPVGSYDLTPSAASGGTFAASNYSITYSPGTLSVTPASLTITAGNDSKTYGQTLTFGSSTAFTSSGLVNGETIGSVTLSGGGAAGTAPVGSYSLIPSAATGGTFAASNYNITYNPGVLTVTAAPLSITARDDSKTYGQTRSYGAGSTAFVSSGLQNGETIGSVTLAASGAAGTAPVGSYSLLPSAATGGTFAAGNYNITYNPGTLTVTAAPLTITASNDSKTYGQTRSYGPGSTAFIADGLQNGETIGSVTLAASGGTGSTAPVGSYDLTPSAATGGTFAAGNYSITYNRGTLSVLAAPLTITALNDSKTYGQTKSYGAGSTAFISSGLVNGETIGSVTLTASGGTGSNAPVGSYDLTPSAASGGTFAAGNYSITYNPGTLSVNPLALVLSGSRTYDGTTTAAAGIFVVSNEVSGDALTLSGNAVLAGANVGVQSISIGTLSLGGAAAGNYTLAGLSGSVTIAAAPLTITASNDSKTYGQTRSYGAGSTAFTSSGLQNGETIGSVTLAASGGTAANAPVGSYNLTPSAASGGTFAASNYTITYNNGTLSVAAAPLSITALNDSKTYGQTRAYGAGSTAFTSSGLVNGETIGSVTLTASGGTAGNAPVGSYELTPSAASGGTFAAGNYSITYNPGTLTVTVAALTITASNDSKTYGQTRAYGVGSTAFTSSGLLNGETIGSVTLTASGGTAGNAGVGSYSLTPSAATGGTFAASNYSITYTSGTLTVTPAPLTVTANNASRAYGASNPTLTASYSGFVNGEGTGNLAGTLSLYTSANTASAAGTYAIIPSGLSAANYAITFVNGTLTVTPAALTVRANDATRAYGSSNPTFSATYSGFVNGEGAGNLLGTLALTTPATSASGAGTYAITPSGLSSPNYAITYINGTLTVTAVPLTIKADNASRMYGYPNPTFTASYSGFVNGDGAANLNGTLNFTTPAGPTSSLGSYKLTPGGVSSANYVITFTDGTLSITKAPLTIAGDNLSRPYGAPNPAFTGTITGIRNNDSITAYFTCDATISSAPGVYPITMTNFTGNMYNYNLLSVTPGSLTVTKADTTVALASNSNPAVLNQPVTFTATVSAVSPSQAMPTGSVQFRDGATALATVNLVNGVATFTTTSLSPGSHSITAVYSNVDGNFNGSVSTVLVQVIPYPEPPAVILSNGIVVNGASGGGIQRSTVNSLTIAFSKHVTFDTGAFSLLDGAGKPISSVTLTVASADNASGQTTVTLTFSGSGTIKGSLTDGIYQIVVNSNLVHDHLGQNLGGTNNSLKFHRLFGDFNGDKTVDALDSLIVKRAFGSVTDATRWLDFNGDGKIDNNDLLAARSGYGKYFIY